MDGCVFCQIVAGKIPAQKILEDEDFLAFLGIMPKFPGMTVVVTKAHFDSYVYQSLTDEQLAKMHVFAKKVALSIDSTLGSFRNIQMMEGFDVNHAHLKLYPVYEGKNYDVNYDAPNVASQEELAQVAKKFTKNS